MVKTPKWFSPAMKELGLYIAQISVASYYAAKKADQTPPTPAGSSVPTTYVGLSAGTQDKLIRRADVLTRALAYAGTSPQRDILRARLSEVHDVLLPILNGDTPDVDRI